MQVHEPVEGVVYVTLDELTAQRDAFLKKHNLTKAQFKQQGKFDCHPANVRLAWIALGDLGDEDE